MYMYVGHVFLGFMLSLVCSSVMETPLNSIGKLIYKRFQRSNMIMTNISNTPSTASIDLTDSSQNTEKCKEPIQDYEVGHTNAFNSLSAFNETNHNISIHF